MMLGINDTQHSITLTTSTCSAVMLSAVMLSAVLQGISMLRVITLRVKETVFRLPCLLIMLQV